MKKTTPRLILFLLLLIQAIAVVIPNLENVPLLICVAAVLIALAILVFTGKNYSMAKYMIWYAAAGILLFFALPNGLPHRLNFGKVLSNALEGFFESADSPLFTLSFMILIAVWVFFRKKLNTFWVILRYIAACALMVTYAQQLFGRNWNYETLFIPACVLCLVYELNSMLNANRCPRLLAYMIFCVFCVLVHLTFGGNVMAQVIGFVTFGNNQWLFTVLAVLAAGLLLILENWNSDGKVPVDNELGHALVCWCLVAVAMQLWDAVRNATVLFILFPFVFHFYCIFLQAYRAHSKNRGKRIFIRSWIFILLGMFALSKSLNYAPFTAATIFVLLVAGYLCWRAANKRQNNPQILTGFFGIAALLLMASLTIRSFDELQQNASAVFTLLAASLLWLYTCGEARKINAKASEAYPAEFKCILSMQRYGAVSILLIAVARVIFM